MCILMESINFKCKFIILIPYPMLIERKECLITGARRMREEYGNLWKSYTFINSLRTTIVMKYVSKIFVDLSLWSKFEMTSFAVFHSFILDALLHAFFSYYLFRIEFYFPLIGMNICHKHGIHWLSLLLSFYSVRFVSIFISICFLCYVRIKMTTLIYYIYKYF